MIMGCMTVSNNSDGTFQGMPLVRGVLCAGTRWYPCPYEVVLKIFDHTSVLVAQTLAGENQALRHRGHRDDETVIRLKMMTRKPEECFENVCENWTDEEGGRRSSAQELEKEFMSGV